MDTTGWAATEATIYSSEFVDGKNAYHNVTFAYEIDGRHYTGHYRSAEPVAVESKIEVQYDPKHPGKNDKAENRSHRLYIYMAVLAAVAVIASLLVWL